MGWGNWAPLPLTDFLQVLTIVVATCFGCTSYTLVALMRLFRNDYNLPGPRDTVQTINRPSCSPALMQ